MPDSEHPSLQRLVVGASAGSTGALRVLGSVFRKYRAQASSRSGEGTWGALFCKTQAKTTESEDSSSAAGRVSGPEVTSPVRAADRPALGQSLPRSRPPTRPPARAPRRRGRACAVAAAPQLLCTDAGRRGLRPGWAWRAAFESRRSAEPAPRRRPQLPGSAAASAVPDGAARAGQIGAPHLPPRRPRLPAPTGSPQPRPARGGRRRRSDGGRRGAAGAVGPRPRRPPPPTFPGSAAGRAGEVRRPARAASGRACSQGRPPSAARPSAPCAAPPPPPPRPLRDKRGGRAS